MRTSLLTTTTTTSLLLLLTTGSATPTGQHKTPSCTSKSSSMREWTVSDFDYHASYTFSTPAHQIAGGFVNFTLSNPVLSYKLSCPATSSQLQDFFYGTMVYKCETAAGSGDDATFTFNRPTGELKINQTWSCPSEGSRFEARGGVTLNLSCRDTKWQNPDWKMGQIYSTHNVDCQRVTVKAPVSEMSGVA
ncbi:hypothetical protein L249_4990 [Ophiocordyceps polyrhachis-furcata BCC 54312]|uniref:AA1-like domain-containing protein n=1 Tax=Ophiocordyceps polyrhachis-furcata BCC 54312 TaxID=1330021 RepID=A0A367L3I1_9HYPO|nr:hypothetical protein L249_4990 [Ophiocordyceps polyrhachis-furcata BCC 54312]